MYSIALGMELLVEVNDAQGMKRALGLSAKVIDVNDCNLQDLCVDMGTTSHITDMAVGHDIVLCALSDIESNNNVHRYVEYGVGAVLVGGALMRAADTSAFMKQLLVWPDDAPASTRRAPPLASRGAHRSGRWRLYAQRDVRP